MSAKYFHVETLETENDTELKKYMDFMSVEECMDLVRVDVIHRGLNETKCKWHFIWVYSKDRKKGNKK